MYEGMKGADGDMGNSFQLKGTNEGFFLQCVGVSLCDYQRKPERDWSYWDCSVLQLACPLTALRGDGWFCLQPLQRKEESLIQAEAIQFKITSSVSPEAWRQFEE